MEESLEIIIDRSKFQKKGREDGRRTNKGICLVYYKFLFLHDTKKYFCFVVWWFDRKKKTKKTKMEIWKVFFGIFLFSRRYVLLFFQRWREQSAVHFFSFLEVVTAYSYVTGKKLFWNIFFVLNFANSDFDFWCCISV